ncbi:glycosyltransferase family 4 protein [Luteolibacter pohnpeiensis]|uniref:Glycosyltransferase family 4 protein n=1 Tax=Luteolibacter pohnpeiensis TaxID=454153 RepID=A0A934SA33_9BACT|nr:glycosyltransferase family 4 protein [Luteolibacter pohnpeiensis]MBK1882432.1 glycosyltransferase family 4 protein [Luteolibacter pohnpeiensis]
MKILAISNLYPPHEIGGYEIRCRDIMERIMQRGHDVRILTSDHHVPDREEIAQPHVARKLRIHGFFGHPWLPIHQLYALEAHNHRALQAEIDSFQPDLIHVWNLGGISKSLLHRLENCGIPHVYDISDHWIARSIAGDVWLSWWNDAGSKGRVFARKFAETIGLRKKLDQIAPTASAKKLRFKNIYFCSAFMRDHTVSKGWPVSHASVIHCGIDTGGFTVKQDHSGFSKLLWVGRLSEDKDPLTAIRALYHAHQLGLTHLTLDLFGKGDAAYTSIVNDEISKLNLTEFVRLRLAPAAEMRGLYSQYDALLFTSNWGEPFALTPLEAMASGLPVITSLDGGQKELARDKDNCLIAGAAQPELYAQRIKELSESSSLRESIASTGLTEVREKFDLDPITSQIEEFLTQAEGS